MSRRRAKGPQSSKTWFWFASCQYEAFRPCPPGACELYVNVNPTDPPTVPTVCVPAATTRFPVAAFTDAPPRVS